MLVSVLRQLASDGTSELSHLSWEGPEPLVRSVLVTLTSLGPDACALAEAVAVLGDACTLSQAGRLADLNLPRATAAWGVLRAARILAEAANPAFAHPLLRAVVYQHLPSGLGDGRHARAADVLRVDGAPLEQVALQLLLTRPGGNIGVAESLISAGSRALERGAPDSAVAFFVRALHEPVAEDQLPSLLLSLGTAEVRSGSPAALAHLDQARQRATTSSLRLHATLAQARALYTSGDPKHAVELLRAETLTARQDRPELAASLVEELRTLADVDLTVRQLVHDDPLLDVVAELSGQDAHRASAHDAIALLVTGGSAELAVTLAGVALAGAELEADALAGGSLFFITAFAATCADHFPVAERVLQRAMTTAQRNGDALTFCLAAIQRGLSAFRRGELLTAEADVRSALETVGLNGWLPLAQMARTVLAYVSLETSLPETTVEELGLSAPELTGADLTTQGAVLLEARGQWRLADGDLGGALADLERVGRELSSWGVINPAPFPWRSAAGLAAARLGRPEEGRELAEEELALSRKWGAPRTVSVSLRALAQLSGKQEQLALLEEAVSVGAGSLALLETAHALVDFGAALRRDNKRSDARRALTDGLALAHRCHAGKLVKRAHTELWATGARPRTPVRVGADALTASERRIADMAVQGMSNPAIAQALFITIKTVEMHMTAAFRKLQVRTRGELAGVLATES